MANDSLQEKQNLIKKAYEKLSNSQTLQKGAKAGAALILAANMAVGLSGCNNLPTTPTTETFAQETAEPQLYNIDYSEHSELLKQVLEDKTYNSIIDSYNFDTSLYSHPFAFLESQGYEISSILNGEIKCKTFMFIPDNLPNCLYMSTCVSDPSNRYYTEYMLRYLLTEQEMKDFKSLFYNYEEGCFDNAVFLPDAISRLYLGKEQLCSHANIGIKGNENLNESLCDKPSITELTGAKYNIAVLARFDNENNSFGCYILPDVYFREYRTANSVKRRGKVTYIECLHPGPNFIRSTDDIFAIGDENGKHITFKGNYQLTPGTSMNVTLYSTDGAELTHSTYKENTLK